MVPNGDGEVRGIQMVYRQDLVKGLSRFQLNQLGKDLDFIDIDSPTCVEDALQHGLQRSMGQYVGVAWSACI